MGNSARDSARELKKIRAFLHFHHLRVHKIQKQILPASKVSVYPLLKLRSFF